MAPSSADLVVMIVLCVIAPVVEAVGLGLSVLYAGVVWRQVRALLKRPDGRVLLRRQLASAGAMMPHTPGGARLCRFLGTGMMS
jgi:hypothetical protein